MYVSVTGLKAKGIAGLARFAVLAPAAFKEAQNANGILFCETKTRAGWHHTLTVWETKADMMAYRKSPKHLKSMRAFSQIATGKVYGYEAEEKPGWMAALKAYDAHARDV
ncbi:MAG: hypothetical protein ABJF50_11120 [Paracoccaceae bacterium]